MFRTLIAVLVFMVVFIYLSLLNPHKAHVVLAKGFTVDLPVSILLVVTVSLGFVLAYLLGFLKDIKLAMLSKKVSAQAQVKEKIIESLNLARSFSSEAGKNI